LSRGDETPRAAGRTGEVGPKVRPDRSGPIRAEIVSIGRELLRGETADGNAAAIARALLPLGVAVDRITVVDDREEAIAEAIREALSRNPHLVVTSGGLGPGLDDRTLQGVAAALELPLTTSTAARAAVEAAYGKLHEVGAIRSGGMTLVREKLCRLPIGARTIANRVGVTPGALCKLAGGAAVLCLPGLRNETKAVLDAALPLLSDMGGRVRFAHREIESPTSDESSLQSLLEQLVAEYPAVRIASRTTGPCQQGRKILVSLEASAPNQQDADGAVEQVVGRMLAIASGAR